MIFLQALFPFLLIAQGQPVTLSADTFDLTGQSSVVVTSDLNLNGAVILSRSLVQSDTFFVFTLVGGTIRNGTIIGANGDTDVPEGSGYMGGVRVRTTGRIESVRFINCDKWSVDCRGDRKTLTDTTWIKRCSFIGNRRDGLGYGVWSLYGTVVIDSCLFSDCRHGTDGSSENHRFIITNSSFVRISQSGIHNHLYRDGCSGSGTIVSRCYFANTALDVDLEPAFPPFVNSIADTTRWNGISTGFWIKNAGSFVTVLNGLVVVDTIPSWKGWSYQLYRFNATIRCSGAGAVYLDDFLQGSRYYSHEDGKAPKIRYVIPGGKVDRNQTEKVSGDKSLRIRLELDQCVEVF